MDFAERMAVALDTHNADEAVERTHAVVFDEITAIDPDVRPRLTGYFNHSFVPDMVLEWTEQGKPQSRELFVRHSLLSSEASGDWSSLKSAIDWPIFLSVAPEEPDEQKTSQRAKKGVRKRSRALLTTGPALQGLAREGEVSDPLLGVVRANVVRGARGFLDQATANLLTAPAETRLDADVLEDFRGAVEKSFDTGARHRIARVEAIVSAAVDPALVDLVDWSGTLTEHEIRSILPYLLGLEEAAENQGFWRLLGGMVSLQQLESMWASLDGLDLTPLARASNAGWTAKHAQLSLRADSIDDDEFDMSPRWSVVGRALSAEVGNWRAALLFNGRKLKGYREGSTPARWEDIKGLFESGDLTRVELHGVSRRVTAGSDGSIDVSGDVERIIASIQDSFHVPGLSVQVPAVDGELYDLDIDFTTMLVHSERPVPVALLVETALSILGHRYPTDKTATDELLGRADSGIDTTPNEETDRHAVDNDEVDN